MEPARAEPILCARAPTAAPPHGNLSADDAHGEPLMQQQWQHLQSVHQAWQPEHPAHQNAWEANAWEAPAVVAAQEVRAHVHVCVRACVRACVHFLSQFSHQTVVLLS